MLNKQPIFINAFARGGSNILMNLLLSHPKVCLSDGETHKVFKGTKWNSASRKAVKKIFYDLPIRLTLRQNFFSPTLLSERKKVPLFLKHHIDKVLYNGRFHANIESHNYFKFEGEPYKTDELVNCRLLTKSLNGLVFTMPMFYQMYPDASFFGLIRNGLAICEGYIRRGGNARHSAEIYTTVVEKMLDLSNKIPNYYIVRYEDMVNDTLSFTRDLYRKTNLDISMVPKIRLQSKPIMNKDGEHHLSKGLNRQVFWYSLDELNKHIRSDLNENQIRLLKEKDRDEFLSFSGKIMEKLGYSC